MTEDSFYEHFGGHKNYNKETKSFEIEFDENSPKADPIKALEFKRVWKVPITSVTYQNITYRMEGKDHLIIEGKENCAKQISYNYMNILSVFPYVVEETITVEPENPNLRPYQVKIAVPTKKIDQITKLSIRGHIEDLTECINDPHGNHRKPFQEVYFPRPENEDPCPFKFVHLETIDLSGCVGLKDMNWIFFYNRNLKTMILPDHDFNTHDGNWITNHNEDYILDEDAHLRITLVNEEHAIFKYPDAGGCCNIA